MSPRMTLALLLTSTPIWAQFSQLSATDDGQQLYFTSPLRIDPQSATNPETRVFRSGPDGITLFAERGALIPSAIVSSNDGMTSPQVSGDGSVVAITGVDVCPGSAPCSQGSMQEGMLRGSANTDLGPGSLQISRNGRWAVLAPPRAAPAAPGDPLPPPPQTATLFDLQNNTSTPIPPPLAATGMVAS